MGHHLSGGRTESEIKALIQDSFFPASAPHCYFYSLLSRLKTSAWVERAQKCWSCSRVVFFPSFLPGIFRAWVCSPGQAVLGAGNPSGNISEEGKKEFGEFPPDRSFPCQILLPWLWSQSTLVWQLGWAGKGHIQPGNDISLEKSLKALVGEDGGKKGWKVPFSSARNRAGIGTLHQLFLSAVKGRSGCNFLTRGIFWSFPKSGEDWSELGWGWGEGGGAQGDLEWETTRAVLMCYAWNTETWEHRRL